MDGENRTYAPCLRWKQGEYQAVMRLTDGVKQQLLPLIEVPEMGWDFETSSLKNTVDDHLEPFADRVFKKWGKKRCFVDLGLLSPDDRMSGKVHPVSFVLDGLDALGCDAVPVVRLPPDRDFERSVSKVSSRRGVCFRISIEEAATAATESEIARLLKSFGLRRKECDLVLDLGTPNFVPIEGFAKAVVVVISGQKRVEDWRSFTLLAGSFPASMAEIRTSPTLVPRGEWQLYKHLVAEFASSGLRQPIFGDYGVANPAVLQMDMRLVKPSASIRYTAEDCWYVLKGANVRDYRFGQYRKLCSQVVASPHFCGHSYSWGDEYISNCAQGSVSTGNLTTWRSVGTNHHISKVVHDLANSLDLEDTV